MNVRAPLLCCRGRVLAGLVWAPPAGAEDPRDQTVLDTVVKDLGITLLAKPDDAFVRLPLAPQRWSLFGRMQPYASLSPRVHAPAEEVTGLAAPIRETDALSKGVDVGAGVSWHLSDRFELFGEYQLLNMGGAQCPARGSPRPARPRRPQPEGRLLHPLLAGC